MITALPAVQHNIKGWHRYVCISAETLRWEKRNANRRHRRALNRATRRMCRDPEFWYDEGFSAPSFSNWELY